MSFRKKSIKVKTAKGRKVSSTRWLQRHLNDKFVQMSKKAGYLSRAAFKLIEIDKKFNLIKSADHILELGSSPGGWLQVIEENCKKNARIVAIDLKEIEFNTTKTVKLIGDFRNNQPEILEYLENKPDLIFSDIAPASTGNKSLDNLRMISLAEEQFELVEKIIARNGNFVIKLCQGYETDNYIKEVRKHFASTEIIKPEASYKDSREIYLVCIGKK